MSRITLLDGSVGQEMVRRSGDRPTSLWSTQVMIDHPDLLRAVHDSYFAAGATVATANTSAVLRDRLAKAGIEGRLEELTSIAVDQALAAREANGSGRVAGSIGPLGASYRPDICPAPDIAETMYAETVALLAPRVDVLLLETMSSVAQAEGAMRAANKGGKPVWLSVTVKDDDGSRLRSGEPIEAIAEVIERHAPEAVLINCAPPEVMDAGLAVLRGIGLPFGSLANGFTHIAKGFLEDSPTVEALKERTDLTPEAHAEHAMRWIDMGATIAGGCCEIGPAHITELARRLRDAGHEIV